jgi:uncharacterized protein YecE (DUF72 family)
VNDHDPDTPVARKRAEAIDNAPTLIERPGLGTVRVGISAWTEPTLTAPGVFYPAGATSAEARLKYYASLFPLTEVDSTYYALPTAEVCARWVERTPDHFVFDIKANALMTGHATDVARLPRVLREALPTAMAEQRRIRPEDLSDEFIADVWRFFVTALDPLRDAGKLGVVLLQFPPWFEPSRESARAIERAAERLQGITPAVELRHSGWFEGRIAQRTIEFLRERSIPYVMVDEPQGLPNSVPPVKAVTSPDIAIVRLHGRRGDTWARPNVNVVERFRYLYDAEELRLWIEPVREAMNAAKQVHVVFNNCYGNYATTNAREFAEMFAQSVVRREQ